MIIELSEEYIPKDILFRDMQMKQIRDVFLNYQKIGMGTNLLIQGVTGSGKTTIIKKITEEENHSIYTSCLDKKTAHEVLKSLFNIKIRNQSEVLQEIIKKLLDDPKILIIDEIDKVRDFNNLMNDLNFIYRKTMIPIIIITMKRNILQKMPLDVIKTLFFERISLPSYNAEELKCILESRIKAIQKVNIKISDGAISFISAIASKQGSARVLMNITIRCIQKNNFTQVFIQGIYNELMKQDWIGFINEINESEKHFLNYILDYCDYKKEITSDNIQSILKLSSARVCQLTNTFEKYGVITSRHENIGRAGGRKRIIKFTSKEIYDEINKFSGI